MSDQFVRNRIFISYKKEIQSRYRLFGKPSIAFLPVVERISELLQHKGFSTFHDEHIAISDSWFGQIAEQVIASELILLLLTRGTLQSHWVRSEVHFAEAIGIRVFPLGCGIDTKTVELELRAAGLSHIQGMGTGNHIPGRQEALWEEISEDITSAILKTRAEQSKRLAGLLTARQARRVAEQNQSFAQFNLKMGTDRTTTVHIAAGDMSKFRNIDVIASSENNFMQMARLIDGKTISGLLRDLGAQQSPRHDALQRELDYAVDERRRLIGAPLPIPLGEIVVTSSGSPNSSLRRLLGTRYILHVSSGEVLSNGQLQPLSDEGQLRSCVHNCFEQLTKLEQCRGIISPPDTPQRQQQEAAEMQDMKLNSILIPLFGVGRGGLDVQTVARVIALELKEIFSTPDVNSYGGIKNVYISVYYEEDVEIVHRIFRDLLASQANR